MSLKLCCSLCCAHTNDYKYLQNEAGENTEVYQITVKYFDPMLITEEGNCKFPQENKVLCGDCWVPIKEFHEFQQNVIKARSLLEKSELKQTQVIIKTENEINLEEVNVNVEFDRSDENDENYGFQTINIKSEEIILEADNVNIENEHDLDRSDEDDEEYRFENNNRSDLKEFEEKNATSNDKDEIPLINWRITKDCNKKTAVNYSKDSAKRDRDLKNIVSKDGSQIVDVNETSNLDENPNPKSKKQKQSDIKKEKKNSKSNFEKARESDALIREWKPLLECDLCKETASSYDKLRNHFKAKHKERFYIKCCDRKFYRRYFLVDHIQIHLNPETFKCDICGKVSANKNNLKLHKKLKHDVIKQYECEVCHVQFNFKPSLDRHLLTHVTGNKDFVCQECGKAFVLELQLKCHIKSVHNVDRVCDQCGKTVNGVRAFKEHLMEHGIEIPKFPCDECGVELSSRKCLKRHKASFHREASTVYVCKICGKVAANKSSLIEHKRYVHEDERKHKCTFCDKAFKRPKNLYEHIATHTGQNLYQCPHCPQTFYFSTNMHNHRKKVHPVEWEESRKNRLQVPKVDINHVENQIVF